MAFATTNVQTAVFGNLRATYGQWSGVQADATGSIGVSGGQVWAALFVSQDSSGEYSAPSEVKYSTSTSGNITTITIYNLADVTAGRFVIIHS